MLTYAKVLSRLSAQINDYLPFQILDATHPYHGTFVLPRFGMPTADHTSGGQATLTLCYAVLLDQSPCLGDANMLERAVTAARGLQKLQRSNGLIDLPKVDFNSPPDTAFMVQAACPVLALARDQANDPNHPNRSAAAEIAQALEPFVQTAAQGIVGSGFRTPNHRWVVCSALSQAMTLFPVLNALDYVESILAETIDINTEGVYSERSAGIYDAVCNRAMRMIADHLNKPELLDHVRANLDFLLSMLESDGSILTALSRRQDHGTAATPIGLIDSFYDMAQRDDRADWATAAQLIFDNARPNQFKLWEAQMYIATDGGKLETVQPGTLPDEIESWMPKTGIWRVRQADRSFAVLKDSQNFLSARIGDLQLLHLGFRGSYFHRSKFSGQSLEKTEQGVAMHHDSTQDIPFGWDLPLGRPVEFEHPGDYYYVAVTERERWPLPEVKIDVAIDQFEHGLEVHVKTSEVYDRVPFVFELFFKPDGQWVTDDQITDMQAGQTVFLTQGNGRIVTGCNSMRIGPGDNAHQVQEMLGDAPANVFRVIIPMLTPVNRKLELHWSPRK